MKLIEYNKNLCCILVEGGEWCGHKHHKICPEHKKELVSAVVSKIASMYNVWGEYCVMTCKKCRVSYELQGLSLNLNEEGLVQSILSNPI